MISDRWPYKQKVFGCAHIWLLPSFPHLLSVYDAERRVRKPQVLRWRQEGLHMLLGGRWGESQLSRSVLLHIHLPVSHSQFRTEWCPIFSYLKLLFLCPEQKWKQQQVPTESPSSSRREEAVCLPSEPNPDVCPNGHRGSSRGKTDPQSQPSHRTFL